jgi:hypothetical protein
MSILTDNDVEQIERVVLVANTPRYLIKHLRELAGVQHLATTSSSRLEDVFRDAQSTHHHAICYAVMVALGFKPYSEMLSMISRLDIGDLPWGQHVGQNLRAMSLPLDVTQYAPIGPQVRSGLDSLVGSSSDTATTLVLRPQLVLEEF